MVTYFRNARIKPYTPCLPAEYTARPGASVNPATEDTRVSDLVVGVSVSFSSGGC